MLKLRTIFFSCLIVAAFILAWKVWNILAGFFLALVFATIVDGGAEFLKKIKFPRIISVILIYLVIIVLFYFAFYFLIPPTIEEVGQFSANLPDYLQNFSPQFEQVKFFWNEYKTSETLQKSLLALADKMVKITSNITVFVSAIFGGLFTAFVVVFISFLLSIEENGVKKFLGLFVPASAQNDFIRLFSLSQGKIRDWFRGRLFSALSVGILVYFGLLFMGAKYKVTLALIAALFEFIPIIGAWFSAIIGVALTAFQSLKLGLFALILYLVVQQIEGQISSPFFMKKIVGISPALNILALMIGAKLGGFLGILIAIPVAVIIIEIINDLKRKQKEGIKN